MTVMRFNDCQAKRMDSGTEPLIQDNIEEHDRKSWTDIAALYCPRTAVFAVASSLILTLQVLLFFGNRCQRSFSTDFGDLGNIIPFTQHGFVNHLGPSDRTDGWTLEIEWDKSIPRYTGTPNVEVDTAWHELLLATTFNRSGESASFAVGKTYQYSDGNYLMGLEVFHALHCLNRIRKELYHDHYSGDWSEEPPAESVLHKDHCIDYLRQYIQCNADLTPMWAEERYIHRGPLLKPHQPHTCRDFDRLYQWIMNPK
ncbi:Cyclochlorotine biosynthesis protein O [Pseudocercospora fuligena]|uniref:Cyclochlorotine biosynthesis protein O n=1 Tax=Pseudocercospora fuligena TaxID=685502 RepID=A0A8H6VE98_9PEZI|nr:Cyclochlorotine biosynthesis protein O [Pseudocercospora fuligena]